MNRSMKSLALGVAVLGTVGTTATSAFAASASPAKVSPTVVKPLPAAVQTQLKGAPADVVRWIDGLQAKGEQVLSLTHADYTWKTSAKSNATVRPNDYPVGCGLFVAITRDVDDITSNNLTSCLNNAEEIQMLSGIAYSRWYGWEQLDTDEDGITDSDFLTLDWVYNCHGTGTHDWQTVTNGYVEINGVGADASAYDQINAQACP